MEDKMDNKTIRLIQSHRSTRRYSDKPITDEILKEIFTSAQWAPSSHNVQAYSIIVVNDTEKRKRISGASGSQIYIEEAPVFLVFCADMYRLSLTTEMHGSEFKVKEIENVLVASVDVALAAQNAFLTARSLGIEGVMIGGVRNNPEQIKEILNLPKYTIPIMGMCLGYPEERNWQKPRTPQEILVHYDEYNHVEDVLQGLREYEEISADYYTRRTKGQKTTGWTKQMSEYLSEPRRPQLVNFILEQGFGTD